MRGDRHRPGRRPPVPSRPEPAAASSPPLVSVVIPVYREAPYLQRCLDSVLAQRHRPLEVIVVDDGSADGSADVAARYAAAHACVRVIRQENRGPGPARNTGIAAATGPDLAMVDADDCVEPDFISTMVSRAEATGAEAVVCNFAFELGRLHLPYVLMAAPPLLSGSEAARRTLELLPLPPFAWTKLYRRDWYAAHGFEFPPIWYEDVATGARFLSRAAQVATTRRVLYHYCVRSTGITGDFGVRNVADYVTAVSLLREFVADEGLWTAWRTEYRRLLRFVGLLLTVQIGLQDNTIRVRDRGGLILTTWRRLRSLRAVPRPGEPEVASIDPASYPVRVRRRDRRAKPPGTGPETAQLQGW